MSAQSGASAGIGNRALGAALPTTLMGRRSSHSAQDIARLARRAVADTFDASTAAQFDPDAGSPISTPPKHGSDLVRTSKSRPTVVTTSLGDTCLFRIAGVHRRTAPFLDTYLQSGDPLVFDGPRRVHCGVPTMYDHTGPQDLERPPADSISLFAKLAWLISPTVSRLGRARTWIAAGAAVDSAHSDRG
jgi:hypothetical protein